MDAVQSGLGKNDLGHQVILLTKEIEELKEKHRYHHHNNARFWLTLAVWVITAEVFRCG